MMNVVNRDPLQFEIPNCQNYKPPTNDELWTNYEYFYYLLQYILASYFSIDLYKIACSKLKISLRV